MSRIIEQSVLIDAPVDVVWRAVTEPDRVRLWFADAVDVQASPGHQGSMTFGTDPATATTVHVSVQGVDPPRSLSYRWQQPAGATAARGNSTLVEFTLEAEGDGTRLRVVESGLEELAWPEDEKDGFESDHRQGWAAHLARLADTVLADTVLADTVLADTVLADTVTRQEHARP